MESFGGWAWWIVAGVLAILEMIVPGVFFIWLALAAAVVGLVTLVLPLGLFAQLGVFALAAVIMVLAARRWMQRAPASDHPTLNDRGQAIIGQTVTAVETFANGRGSVKVGDTIWRASGPDVPAGTKLKVTGADGTLLQVEPLTSET